MATAAPTGFGNTASLTPFSYPVILPDSDTFTSTLASPTITVISYVILPSSTSFSAVFISAFGNFALTASATAFGNLSSGNFSSSARATAPAASASTAAAHAAIRIVRSVKCPGRGSENRTRLRREALPRCYRASIKSR